MKVMNEANSLVVDLGTATTRAGWSFHDEPDMSFPTLVGRGRHKGAMLGLGLKDKYVGTQARSLQGILTMRSPLKQGSVQHWEDLETLWEHVWEKECEVRKANNLDPSEHQVLLSVPPLCSAEDWKQLTEMFIEGYGFRGVYLANKSVLSLYGGGRTTGVCVDSGEDMTYVVPCWEGTPLPNATLATKLGGRHVTDRLLNQLSHGKYSFPDDTFLLWRQQKDCRFCVATRREIVQQAKERFCRFSDRPINDNHVCSLDDEQVLRLPDGNMVVVGEESVSAPELMFQPKKGPGLHELVVESVMRCDEGLRPRLLANVVLTGGNTLIPGMDVRLQKELTQLLPSNAGPVKVRVHAQNGRERFTWSGGAHLTSLSSFQRLWLTKQDYSEAGAIAENGSGHGEQIVN